MESCLSSSIESEICINGILNKFFLQHLGFIFIINAFKIGFSIDELNKKANIKIRGMNIW